MAGPGAFFTRPWDSQPPGVPDIDWANPISSRLAFAWSATSATERVTGVLANTNNTVQKTSIYGVVAKSTTGQVNTEWSREFIRTSNGTGTGDFTMLVVANPATAGVIGHLFSQKNDAAGSPFSQVCILTNADSGASAQSGSLAFFINNGGSSATHGTFQVDGGWHVWAGVRRGTSHELWRDGVLQSSNASTVRSILQSGSQRYTAVGSRGNGTADGYGESALIAAGWDRALSRQEIEALGRIDGLWGTLFEPRRILVPVAAAGGGAGVGLCTEANSALALAAVQRRAAGLSTEADAALSLAAAQVRPSGLSLQSDAAQALAAVQRRTAGLAVETDAAIALGAVQARPAGLAVETSSSLALSARQIRAAGLATESDAALALSAPGGATVGLSSEADVALELTARQVRTAGLAAETSTALALTPGAAPGTVGLATETDTALKLAAVQKRGTGLATETSAALALPVVVARGVSLALEIDAGFALGIVQRRAVGRSDELDAALTLAGGGSPEPAADPERTYFVPAESRVWRVPAELRTHAAPP